MALLLGIPGALVVGLIGTTIEGPSGGFGYAFLGGWILFSVWAYSWLGKNRRF